MGTMTTPENRAKAIERVRARTEHLERVQELSQLSVSSAGRERARAIKEALELVPAKDLAAEMGVSVQRVYKLAREAE